MAIDIRASITCELGDIIQANIADSSISEAGLIKTTGVCEVLGLSTPAIGTSVSFTYTDAKGTTRKVPRTLFVLSSFANPYKRTTEIQLGCALTYKEGLKEKVKWQALDDPANSGYTTADQQIITVPINASSVFNYCLQQLGLTATSNPLTNKFSIAEFDYSAGYVQVMNDLLVSESYCGFINGSGQLEIFSLDQASGSGPVLGIERIIDIGGINAGPLPGEAVVVNYSTLKLKQPDNSNSNSNANKGALWELTSETNRRDVTIQYTNASTGDQSYTTYSVIDSATTYTYYTDLKIKTLSPSSTANTKIISGYENVRKVYQRVTYEDTGSVSVEGSYASNRLANGYGYNNVPIRKTTVENFYYDEYGNENYYTSETTGSLSYVVGNMPVQEWVIAGTSYIPPSSTIRPLGKTVRITDTIGDYQRVTTHTYGLWTDTIAGQQALATGFSGISTIAQLDTALGLALNQLYLLGTRVTTRRTSEGEVAPTGADVTNSASANGGDPANGYRTDSSVELELALGSATAQRRIEFQLPYAPDDTFYKTGSTYGSTASDAPQKAARYGRVQNGILLANRNGMSLQCAADVLPPRPYMQFTVTASGISGVYRTNALSWTMSSDGIVASTDALFIGGAGAASGGTPTSVAFFPTSPTITTLPVAPAVVNTAPSQVIGTIATVASDPQTTLSTAYPSAVAGDGVQDQATDEFWVYSGTSWTNVGTNPGPTMTVTNVVPVWNEAVKADGLVRLGVSVQSLAYPLQVLTQVPAYGVKVQGTAVKILKVQVPAAALDIASTAPTVSTGVAVAVPASELSIAAIAPTPSNGAAVAVVATTVQLAPEVPVVSAGASVTVPAVDLVMAGQSPVSAGPPGQLLNTPSIDIALTGLAPAVSIGVAVTLPSVDIALTTPALVGAGNIGNGSDMTILVEDDLRSLLF